MSEPDHHTLEQLLNVAARMFGERGFDGVSVREIARESGVSMAAIYHHFRNKEGLFAEVSLHKYEDFAQDALELIRRYQREHYPAVAFALAFFDMMVDDEDLFRLLQRDLIVGAGDQRHFRSHPQFEQLVRHLDEQLGLRREDPRSEVQRLSLTALINGYCELAMAERARQMRLGGERGDGVIAHYRHCLERFVSTAFDTPR